MQIKAEEISQIIKGQIKEYETKVDLSETGTVISVGDGIARVYGVGNCMAMELLEFPGGILGLALNLESDNVGCAVLGDVEHIKEGVLDRQWKAALLMVLECQLTVWGPLKPMKPGKSK
jgi:F-type H+-transporting ATPase subunit alpha